MKKTLTLLFIICLCSVSHARTYMFRAKASKINNFLHAKGWSGSTHDMLMSEFKQYSSLSDGTLYDHVNDVLGQNGCSGTIDDKMNCFFGGPDGERSWWDNTSNTFDPSGGSGNSLIFESGNNFIFESGNNFILEG